MKRLTEWYKGKAFLKKPVAKTKQKATKKLAAYEDAEEKGTLLKLPCEIGATVYVLAECKNIPTVLDGGYYDATGYYCPYELYDNCPHECFECEEVENKTAVFEDSISYIGYDETGLMLFCLNTGVSGSIGEYIFLTKEAAEKALTERGKHGD